MNQDCTSVKTEDLQSVQKTIRSGFVWLGTASIVSQILDAISTLVVIIYIREADMGVATLAVQFSKCIEAFIALGVGKALVQDNALTDKETSSLFWFASVFGIALAVGLIPVAWGLSSFYHAPMLVPLFLVCLLDLVFLNIGEVPKKLVERRLEYSKCTLIFVIATFVSSLVKIVLAVLGTGAWSLVLAYTSYGFVFMVTAFAVSKYRPEWHFNRSECKRFVQFGYKYCLSNLIETLNKNIHYFVIGKYFDHAILGMYRVGYELAMTPALALLNVVNQSSYAVFAKIKDKKDELSKIFAWNQGNIAIFAMVPIVFILFCSEDIFSLMDGGKWMPAVQFIPFVLGIAFIKSLVQTFPELYRASGKPEYSLRTDIFECFLICIFFAAALAICALMGTNDDLSLKILFVSWLLLFVPLFFYHRKLAKKLIDTGFRSMLRSISKAGAFFGVAYGLSFPLRHFQNVLPWQPWFHMVMEVLILLACIGWYMKWIQKSPTISSK